MSSLDQTLAILRICAWIACGLSVLLFYVAMLDNLNRAISAVQEAAAAAVAAARVVTFYVLARCFDLATRYRS